MSFETWRADLEADLQTLNAAGRSVAIHEQLTEQALAQLWLRLATAPLAVRNAYELLLEEDLAEASRQRRSQFEHGSYRWDPRLGSADETVFLLAVEIRALDVELFAERDRTRDSGRDAYRAAGDVPVYVLPRAVGSGYPGSDGQAFERRGLVHHRILPQQIEGVEIVLHTPSTGVTGAGGTVQLASCVFARADLDLVESGRRFHARGLRNETDVSQSVDVQLDDLDAGSSCLAAVWPELSIPPEMLAQITGRLRQRGLAGASPLGFVVAGSWHDAGAAGRVNRSVVLNGRGHTLLEVEKRQLFHLRRGVIEGIAAGNSIPVLVWGDLLIAFGICKDFCEKRHWGLFEKLDVDLIIVPSMGGENTMTEHVKAADRLTVQYGTRVFVVQQRPTPADGGPDDVWGLVLPPAQKARDVVPDPKEQRKLLDRTSISCTTA